MLRERTPPLLRAHANGGGNDGCDVRQRGLHHDSLAIGIYAFARTAATIVQALAAIVGGLQASQNERKLAIHGPKQRHPILLLKCNQHETWQQSSLEDVPSPKKTCIVRDILSKNTVDTVAGDAYKNYRKEVMSHGEEGSEEGGQEGPSEEGCEEGSEEEGSEEEVTPVRLS